ncbi:MAG: metallopeptidase family protein [Actinomycetota bacterium]
MVRISPEEFEKLVVDAIEHIPEPFASQLSNVDVVIEDEPTDEDLVSTGLTPGDTLFGLYQGIPQTERTANYSWVMPDKVTIFRGPISRACDSAEDIREEVTVTVVHELAHHFGISDERLEELGW